MHSALLHTLIYFFVSYILLYSISASPTSARQFFHIPCFPARFSGMFLLYSLCFPARRPPCCNSLHLTSSCLGTLPWKSFLSLLKSTGQPEAEAASPSDPLKPPNAAACYDLGIYGYGGIQVTLPQCLSGCRSGQMCLPA